MERKTKAKAETGAYLVVIAAILIVANVISFGLYKRFDTTKNERFTLSKGSARLVSEGLKQDLQIDVYVTHAGAKFDNFIQDLGDLMNEYERASKGKLHYSIIEAKTDDQRQAAKDAGLQEAAFGEGSKTGKDQALISRGFMGISFKYGSEKEAIPVLSPEQGQGLEFWITTKIREIRDRADDLHSKVGIITGKDEIKITEPNLIAAQPGRGQGPTMKGILQQALPFYQIEDVDLQNGDADINKDLAGIIITQPNKDYSEKELKKIDQFLMLGNKSLAVFAGAVNLKASDAKMNAELNTHGLEKLLEGYGVEMKKEAVFDWGRPAMMRVQTQGQVVFVAHPAVLGAQYDSSAGDNDQFLDQNFWGFFRMDELGFPFPSTLVPHPEKQPGASVKVVARSTANSTVVAGETVDMKLRADMKPQGADFAQHAIAIAVEGKVKSAFGAGEADKSRILVISAAQFLDNPFARSGNAPPMPPQMAMMGPIGGDEDLQLISMGYAQGYVTEAIISFKNILDWMGGDPDLIAVSAKILNDSNLTYADIKKPSKSPDVEAAKKDNDDYGSKVQSTQQKVQLTLIVFPALLFAALGLLRRWLRENARAKIAIN